MDNEKLYKMDFTKVYSLLIAKAERKGRTKDEVDEITCWLTGYSLAELAALPESGESYAGFFERAPAMNPRRTLIKGSVCGVRVENIEDPLMRDVRYLDKMVDELAKGKKMDAILRRFDGE